MSEADMDRIDRIFELSDKNADGCLDEVEFAELVRTMNPEVALDESQLELIREEVWAAFPEHVGPEGLTRDGLEQIYREGYADLDRDYGALLAAEAYAAAAAAAAAAAEEALLVEHVSGGRVAHAGRGRQPALADASPLPATPAPPEALSPDVFGALATPAPGPGGGENLDDVFSAVQTPAPAAVAAADAQNALSFAVLLSGVTSQAEFEAGAARRHVLAALKESLPEGTATAIAAAAPTPQGLAVGVACRLPDGAMGGEEEAYFSAVLGAEPEQVFPHATFGHVEVLSADPRAAMGGAVAAGAAAEALAAAALAGGPGRAPLAFCVRLADVVPAEFRQGPKGMAFIDQVRAAMPPGAAGRVVALTPAAGGAVVTVAASVPADQAKQAQHFIRKLRHEPAAVFDAAALGPVALVAAHHPRGARPSLGLQLRLPKRSAEDVTAPADLAAALETALPSGTATAVRRVQDSPRGGAAVVTLAAALPSETDATGLAAAAEVARNAGSWAPAAAAAGSRCIAAGPGLEAAFPLPEDLTRLSFGLGQAAEAHAESQQPRSPSRLMARLFGRPAVPEAPPAPVEPDSPASPPLDAMIAGYQRRSPSSSGSAGLADAASLGAGGAAAAAAALAAEEAVTPGKAAKASEAVISVTAYAPGPPEPPAEAEVAPLDEAISPAKDKKKGWLSRLASSVSPQKRRRGGAADPEDDDAGPSALPPPQPTFDEAALLEEGPRAMTPWDVQQRINAKEWAVMDAHVSQILAKASHVIDGGSASEGDVAALQDSASLLPPWAAHAAHMELGEKLSAAGLFAAAARSFSEAAAAWPDDPLARFRLGNAHFAMHEYLDASRAYFDALRRCADDDPLLVKIHINMGIALESEGRMDAAEREYAKAAALAPGHPRVHKLLGSARVATGDAAGAVVALRRALEINPDFADAWADLGCAYAALNDPTEARGSLEKAIALDASHVEAHFNLGNLERQCGDMGAALAHYDRVLALDPDHWRSWLGRGVVVARAGLGRGREAADCLERAMYLSGHGGALVEEVDALHAMLRRGDAMEALSQQVSAIEERARAAAAWAANREGSASVSRGPGASVTSASASGVRSGSVVTGGAVTSHRLGPKQLQQSAASASSVATATLSASRSMSVSVSHGAAAAAAGPLSRTGSVHSANPLGRPSAAASPERLAAWTPPATLAPGDVAPEAAARLREVGIPDIAAAAASLDLPLIQAMQPVSTVSLEEIWAEAMDYESEMMRAEGGRRSARSSPTKLSPRGGRVVHVAVAEGLLRRLVAAHAQPHLADLALRALCGTVLGLLDHDRTGAVDLAMLLCVLVALADAPSRDRLDLTYRLLMWRTRGGTGGGEEPPTRNDLVEVLSTLKMVFEAEHKTSYLRDRAAGRRRAADGQVVLFEKFAAEVGRFFWAYEALPLLSNPLDG